MQKKRLTDENDDEGSFLLDQLGHLRKEALDQLAGFGEPFGEKRM